MIFNDKLIGVCIQVLRKSDIAVIIGCEIDGDVRSKNRHNAIYDGAIKGDFYLYNGEKFVIPQGKFHVEMEDKKND